MERGCGTGGCRWGAKSHPCFLTETTPRTAYGTIQPVQLWATGIRGMQRCTLNSGPSPGPVQGTFGRVGKTLISWALTRDCPNLGPSHGGNEGQGRANNAKKPKTVGTLIPNHLQMWTRAKKGLRQTGARREWMLVGGTRVQMA